MLYKCNSCDYYSNRKFNLQIHVQRKHANENKFGLRTEECDEVKVPPTSVALNKCSVC